MPRWHTVGFLRGCECVDRVFPARPFSPAAKRTINAAFALRTHLDTVRAGCAGAETLGVAEARPRGASGSAGPRSQSTARAADYVDNGTPLILRVQRDGISVLAEEQEIFSLRRRVRTSVQLQNMCHRI